MRATMVLAMLAMLMALAQPARAESRGVLFVGRLVEVDPRETDMPPPQDEPNTISLRAWWYARIEVKTVLVGTLPEREVEVLLSLHTPPKAHGQKVYIAGEPRADGKILVREWYWLRGGVCLSDETIEKLDLQPTMDRLAHDLRYRCRR
ncbi:MAG TPA: hypothetical protein VG939_19765 [Caulobacteraceae bacterium]|nr:hypothetical protein [Caulobacteraceae bacterium]